MSGSRVQFEKLGNIKVVISACTFNESDNEYQSNRLPEYSLGFVNGSWYAYQEKQSEIDQLKAKNIRLTGLLKEQKRCFDECSQMVSDLIKERDQLKAEKAGLEERIDQALSHLSDVRNKGMDQSCYLAIKTLRGEHE